jgi:hypothetical protein
MLLPPFNPLDKRNLGRSVADALVQQEFHPLPPAERFEAAGIYAIYYFGDLELYQPLTNFSRSRPPEEAVPIYVGKAVPDGSRKGGSLPDDAPGSALSDRLKKHSQSIRAAKELNLADFKCRFLSVDSIWIPLGETLLIDRFSPLWNHKVEGFGNNDPGKGRHLGKRSPWDVLHPGRTWADKLQPGRSRKAVIAEIAEYLAATYST